MPLSEDPNRHTRYLRRWRPFLHPPTG
jgi:hypothetical protein